jgi:hypothetical protein
MTKTGVAGSNPVPYWGRFTLGGVLAIEATVVNPACATVQTPCSTSPTFRVSRLLQAVKAMNIDASIFDSDLSATSDASPQTTDRHVDIEHAEDNVKLWSSYLSPECVNTMIRMGWHKTT